MSSEETFEVTRAFISAIAAIMVHTDEPLSLPRNGLRNGSSPGWN